MTTASPPQRTDPRRGSVRWVASILATFISTYVLDLVATASGLLLAWSGAMSGLDHATLLGVLAVSYAGWVMGLRVNLRSNLVLLEQTGMSTNILSKAAYDLSARGSTNRRRRRLAAGLGYLLSELLKEVPYYLGALGTTALSDGLTANDALIFLAGANLGAGLYEYSLSGLTRGLLSRRGYAAFETDWDPAAYLREYYSHVEPDEVETIAFLVDAVKDAPRDRPVLLYGVGPTLHHVFLAAPVASELHLGEYLPQNRHELRRWLRRQPDAHDWRPFVRYTLQREGIADPDPGQVSQREELTRSRVSRLVHVDARHPPARPDQYAVVISAYCADSATDDLAEWEQFMHAIMAHVAPGGLFATAALHRSHGYTVGGRTFPSVDVDMDDMVRVVDNAWGPGIVVAQVRQLTDQPDHGYDGIILATAVRPDERVNPVISTTLRHSALMSGRSADPLARVATKVAGIAVPQPDP